MGVKVIEDVIDSNAWDGRAAASPKESEGLCGRSYSTQH